MIKLFLVIFVITALFIGGCGAYSFRGNNPPEGIKALSVPLFVDNSGFSEAGLKEQFTEQLKRKIISDNTFILADKSKADGLLICTINTVKDDALVISGNENVTKRKITIAVNVYFENLKKSKKIWERVYENWGEYNSSSSSFSERAVGINSAQDKITEDILNDITSNW
ncbi:MAG: LPS assembly lipoprotein LptE [Ignavibacteriae bacterium]|nr:LPS assembly lipoprotein LptE [Ignavibacteriota bacterium]